MGDATTLNATAYHINNKRNCFIVSLAITLDDDATGKKSLRSHLTR